MSPNDPQQTTGAHVIKIHESPGATAKRAGAPSALACDRLEAAKVAFSCRRVPVDDLRTIVRDVKPRAGDLVLARVTRKRQHTRIELPNGRKAGLYVGDEIVVSYGNRYASDQFEALVPPDLGPCHLVASGGMASRMLNRHRSVRPATEIDPVGLLGDLDGRPVNLSGYAIAEPSLGVEEVPCLAFVGSSMNSGKTTSAAHLVNALRRSGRRVGAAKITGTGSGGDVWKLLDAGASDVVDFTDGGYASTYRVPLSELTTLARKLVGHLTAAGAEVVVLEIADGVFQQETDALLRSEPLRCLVDGYLMAVTDALGATAGADWMRRHGLPLLALCGTLTRSPLAVREAVQATQLPVLSLSELRNPNIAANLLSALEARHSVAGA